MFRFHFDGMELLQQAQELLSGLGIDVSWLGAAVFFLALYAFARSAVR